MSTRRLEACPDTPATRMDARTGWVLYGLAAAMLGALGMGLGATAGGVVHQLGLPEATVALGAILGAVLPVAYIGWNALCEAACRGVIYQLERTETSLGITLERRGPTAALPLPLGRIGAVSAPVPWPSAVKGEPAKFTIPLAAIRSVHTEPHTLDLGLSAERTIGLFLRGHEPEALAELETWIGVGRETAEG